MLNSTLHSVNTHSQRASDNLLLIDKLTQHTGDVGILSVRTKRRIHMSIEVLFSQQTNHRKAQ